MAASLRHVAYVHPWRPYKEAANCASINILVVHKHSVGDITLPHNYCTIACKLALPSMKHSSAFVLGTIACLLVLSASPADAAREIADLEKYGLGKLEFLGV